VPADSEGSCPVDNGTVGIYADLALIAGTGPTVTGFRDLDLVEVGPAGPGPWPGWYWPGYL
jgi:hypothetical protein